MSGTSEVWVCSPHTSQICVGWHERVSHKGDEADSIVFYGCPLWCTNHRVSFEGWKRRWQGLGGRG